MIFRCHLWLLWLCIAAPLCSYEQNSPVSSPADQQSSEVAIPSKNNLHPATPSTDRDTLLEDRLRALELPSDEQHGGEEAFTAAFANMLKTLAFLVGALLLASWMLKKFLATRNQQLNGAGSIKILEQRPLSHRTALYIVEIEEKRFVLAESAQGVSLLTELSSDIQPSP